MAKHKNQAVSILIWNIRKFAFHMISVNSYRSFVFRSRIKKFIFRLHSLDINKSKRNIGIPLCQVSRVFFLKLQIAAQMKMSRNSAYLWQYLWMILTENGLEHSNNVTLNVCDMTKSVQMWYEAGKVNLLERFWFESITFEHE